MTKWKYEGTEIELRYIPHVTDQLRKQFIELAHKSSYADVRQWTDYALGNGVLDDCTISMLIELLNVFASDFIWESERRRLTGYPWQDLIDMIYGRLKATEIEIKFDSKEAKISFINELFIQLDNDEKILESMGFEEVDDDYF